MIEIKHLKKGNYMLHKGEPAMITSIGFVVTGTHSHGKMKVQVRGLFSGKGDSFTLPLHERVQEVKIIRKLAQLIAKNPNNAQVMDMQSFETVTADADDELMQELNEGDNVTYVEFEGKARVIEKR